MKNIYIIVILILVVILCENDRTFKIKHNMIDYYIKNFPIQIYFGIHNSVYRWFYPNRMYDISIFNLEKNLKDIKNDIIINFFKYKDKVIEYAHNTTDILSQDASYKYVRLLFLGKKNRNIHYFTSLEKLIDDNKNIKTCFMSIMESKKTIPYHRGPYNGLLRYHFPLVVDNNDDCYIKVLNKKYRYNKSFVFDDTHPHTLVKKNNLFRLVLIMDIDNPHTLNFVNNFIHNLIF